MPLTATDTAPTAVFNVDPVLPAEKEQINVVDETEPVRVLDETKPASSSDNATLTSNVTGDTMTVEHLRCSTCPESLPVHLKDYILPTVPLKSTTPET